MADYNLQFTETTTAVTVPVPVVNTGDYIEVTLNSGNEGTLPEEFANYRYIFGQAISTGASAGFGIRWNHTGSDLVEIVHNSTTTTHITVVEGTKIKVVVLADGLDIFVDDVFYEKITNVSIALIATDSFIGCYNGGINFGSTFKLMSFNINGEQFDCNEGSGTTVTGDSATVGTFVGAVLWDEIPVTTTTVEVEWIDSISAAATGNKIYRDDVEIADIANGIQIYQDATAETGTEYKYEVQAYSATDETTQEVLGVNVQYITTA